MARRPPVAFPGIVVDDGGMAENWPRCPACGMRMAKRTDTSPAGEPRKQSFVYCQNPVCVDRMKLRPVDEHRRRPTKAVGGAVRDRADQESSSDVSPTVALWRTC